jgi:hypothetical protein
VNVHDYRIEANRWAHGTVHCLAGGRKRCAGFPEYVLHFEYSKWIRTKDGTKHESLVVANRPACRMHAERFAVKHQLQVPPQGR